MAASAITEILPAVPDAPEISRDDRQALKTACGVVYPGFRALSPGEDFRRMAAWCEANGAAHDVYGEGGLIVDFESKVAALVGKPSAAFMPSGVMAQLIAVRIWTQRTALPRFGFHPTSHLILHELEAYQALFALHGVPVGDRLAPMTAADLAATDQPLACLIVELPIREAGGRLPSWDELEALKAAARARGLTLHLDGARLWECRAFYGRDYPQIVEGFASVYVSTYKALGGIAGAVLAGDEDFIAEARLWRRRMGGTLVHQSPMIVSAALRMEERLGMLGACHDRSQSLAEGLRGLPGLRLNPDRPQTNMLHLHFDAPAATVRARRDAIAAREGVWVINDPRPSDVPGWCVSELYVGDTLTELDNDTVVPRFAALLG